MGEPILTYVDLGPELPGPEEFLRGKALLQSLHGGGPKMHDENRESDPNTGNLYEHLVSLLKVIMEEKPTHALDQFEELSRRVKREYGGGTGGSAVGMGIVKEDIEATAPTAKEDAPEYTEAQVERTLFQHPKHKWDDVVFSTSPLPEPWGGIFEDEEEVLRLQNLGQTAFLVEQAAAGLGRTEMIRVWLSLRKLSLKLKTIVKLRFWGKVFGTHANYYIAEGEFEEGSEPDDGVPGPYDDWRPYKRPEPPQEEAQPLDRSEHEELPEEEQQLTDAEAKFLLAKAEALQNAPKSKWCPPAPIPPEPRGRGTNRWDYFACTKLGSDEWFRLPPARPEHIFFARHMRRFLRGEPDAEVPHTPGLGRFPGLEVHLLRATIARITAGTWISPAGLYEIDEEAELEEGEQPETLMEVEDFEPPEFEELLEPANWQHTRPHILPQGRCSFVSQKRAVERLRETLDNDEENEWISPIVAEAWRAKFAAQDENEEEMEEETGEEGEEEIPQEGPGLLGTIEEDAALEPEGLMRITRRSKLSSRPSVSWNVRPSSVLLPKNCSVAVVSSARWPGAYTLARGADFVNLYVGWGLKSLEESFSPFPLPPPPREFDEEAHPLIEAKDPTPLEEEAYRARKEARRLARQARLEEEEGGEEGGEEAEEEED